MQVKNKKEGILAKDNYSFQKRQKEIAKKKKKEEKKKRKQEKENLPGVEDLTQNLE